MDFMKVGCFWLDAEQRLDHQDFFPYLSLCIASQFVSVQVIINLIFFSCQFMLMLYSTRQGCSALTVRPAMVTNKQLPKNKKFSRVRGFEPSTP